MASAMTESDVAETLSQIVQTLGCEWGTSEAEELVSNVEGDEDHVEAVCNARVTSFSDGMVLTNNAGFTLRLEDGSEFQVTVVRK